jgi:zinc transporter, ZIP family
VNRGRARAPVRNLPPVGEAFWWGLLGGIALLIGAVLSFGSFVTKRALGLAMAFGAGVLISAVAFDLVEEAFLTTDRGGTVGAGMLVGAFVFFLGDAAIDRMGGANRKRSSGDQAGDASLGIVLGAVLDGIPESIVLGASLLTGEGVSAAFIAAVFISNLPEGLAGSTGLRLAGWSRGRIVALWTLVALVSAGAAAFGYVALDGASPEVTAFTLAFAGGAVLTMLADTMMPEAFEHGGRVVGLFTTAGFGVAFFLHNLG